MCQACNTLRRLAQELRFTPHSRLEARVAVSWLESALRGLEVLRDASHFQSEASPREQGLTACPAPPSTRTPPTPREATQSREATSAADRREETEDPRRERERPGGEETERRERRRERGERERDVKRRRRG